MKMQWFLRRVVQLGLVLSAVLVFLFPAAVASAHGSVTAGDYLLEIGFKNEPALQDDLNGLDLVVRNLKTNQPVTGLEDTLQAELIFGASKKTLRVEPVEGEQGAYTAAFIPTEAGDYTWHIFGKIENTPVDVSLTSSPTTFASVDSRSSVSFPAGEPSVAALRAELRRARITAIVGVVLGAIGLLLGIASLVMSVTRGKGISLR